METTLSHKEKKVVISPNHPFVMIGERINPTRRKKLAETIANGDFSLAQADAVTQMKAGAQVLDINAGIPGADEPALLRGAVQAVMEVVDIPLCFDSANLIKRAADYGLPPEDIIIDPLALTVSADHTAGRVTLDSIRLIQQELGVNMNLGASNVSFGLPDRKIVNVAYLALAISCGLTTAITDPTVPEIQTTLLACDLLMGRDEYSMRWIKAFRAREKAKAAQVQ